MLYIVLWIYKAIGVGFVSLPGALLTGVWSFRLIHLSNWMILIHRVATIAHVLIVAAISSIGEFLNGLPTDICQP